MHDILKKRIFRNLIVRNYYAVYLPHNFYQYVEIERRQWHNFNFIVKDVLLLHSICTFDMISFQLI